MNKKRVIAFVLLILVVGVGFGFATVVLSARRDTEASLLIEEQKDPVVTESGVEGHHDFRFRNSANRPFTVSVDRKDCECAHVQICVTPEEWKGLDSEAFLKHSTEAPLAWQLLERGGNFFVIPPQSEGLIRVAWKAVKVGPSSIRIVLRVGQGGKEITQDLAARVRFVAPAFFCSADDPNATEIDLGRLKPGEERTAHFLCCSTTRERFTLTPAPSNDPCIVYGTPQPLTPEELQALSQKSGAGQVRAGYHVRVAVREQVGDHRLDIGPFHLPIVYNTDVHANHQVKTHVNGTVEGELSLVDSGGKDFIDLGTIAPSEPKPTTFTVESRDPQVQLTIDKEKTLPFLKVELLDDKEGNPVDKRKRWRVSVVFWKEALFRGVFPDPSRPGYGSADISSIVFLISRPGQPDAGERRFLVPVRGNVSLY